MRRLLLLPVLALVGVMFVASPANAATVTTFTANGSADDITVTAGDDVTLAWTVATTGDPAGEITVTAAGSAAGDVDGWSGTVTSPTTLDLAPGAYEFAITATEVDVEGSDTSEPITVTVLPADEDLEEIEAPEITFPDPCTVVLPDVENVQYGVGFGQSGSALEAGEFDLGTAQFYNFGEVSTFVVNPAEGFTFPEGTQTAFPIEVSQDCFPQLIDYEAICQGVTFTNTTDETRLLQYGDITEESPDEEFELAAGQSRTVTSDRDLVFFLTALDEDVTYDQAGFIGVEQDCTPASAGATHPTVAPAAGSDSGSTAGLGALAALTLAGGAALGVRRLRRTA